MKRAIPDGEAYHLVGAVRDYTQRLRRADLSGLSAESKGVVTAELAWAALRIADIVSRLDPAAEVVDVIDRPDLAEEATP